MPSPVAEAITEGMQDKARALAKAKKAAKKSEPSVATSSSRYVAKLGNKIIRVEPGTMGLATFDKSDKPLETYLYQNLEKCVLTENGFDLVETTGDEMVFTTANPKDSRDCIDIMNENALALAAEMKKAKQAAEEGQNQAATQQEEMQDEATEQEVDERSSAPAGTDTDAATERSRTEEEEEAAAAAAKAKEEEEAAAA